MTDLCDEALLLTSELVTNALVHTGSALEIAVSTTPGSVTVRVQDADTGPIPASTPPAEDELIEGGRGLVLVHELSEAWGTEHQAGRKAVWFRLALESDPPDGAEPAEKATSDQPGAERHGQEATWAEQRLSTLLLGSRLEEVLGFEGRV